MITLIFLLAAAVLTASLLWLLWTTPSPFRYPVLVLMFAIWLGFALSRHTPSAAYYTAILFVTWLAFYLPFFILARWPVERWLWLSLSISAIIIALLTPFTVRYSEAFFRTPDLLRHLPRLPVVVNENIVGGVLIVQIPALLAESVLAYRERRHTETMLAVTAGVAATAALVLTRSLGAYVTAIATFAVMLVAYSPVIGLAAMGGAGYLAFTHWAYLGPRVADALVWRTFYWSKALETLAPHPWRGIGISEFSHYMRAQYGASYPFMLQLPVKHTHNIFFQVALETGVGGVIGLLGLVIGLLWVTGRLLVKMRQEHSVRFWAPALGSVGSLTALIVHGLIDVPGWGTKGAPFIWYTLGVFAALGTYRVLRPSLDAQAQSAPDRKARHR